MQNKKDYLKNLDLAYIDDDDEKNTEKIGELLKNFFRNVYIFNKPKEFLKSLKVRKYDLIFSDICMPECSGIELVRIIRSSNRKIPIVLLTAFSNEEYLLESINLDIQAYLIKPLNFEKLNIAFEKVLNYLEITNNLAYYIHDFSFNRDTRKLTKNGKEILLNKKERNLLHLLISNPNKIVSYEEINAQIWLVNHEFMTENALRTVIKTLRMKLDETSLIKNVSGQGYIIESK